MYATILDQMKFAAIVYQQIKLKFDIPYTVGWEFTNTSDNR